MKNLLSTLMLTVIFSQVAIAENTSSNPVINHLRSQFESGWMPESESLNGSFDCMGVSATGHSSYTGRRNIQVGLINGLVEVRDYRNYSKMYAYIFDEETQSVFGGKQNSEVTYLSAIRQVDSGRLIIQKMTEPGNGDLPAISFPQYKAFSYSVCDRQGIDE